MLPKFMSITIPRIPRIVKPEGTSYQPMFIRSIEETAR